MQRTVLKVLLIIGLAIVGALVLVEGSLRLILGLGNPPLYVSDPEIGYLLAPNQQVRRLRNRIRVNQYSMRAASVAQKLPESTLRVFLLGDSVANGAWWTDQDETISALMERQLEATVTDQVEVLNASANSWGPRNELAYLHRFGTFEAQVIVLLINTDDLFATAPTSLPVGRDRNYPDRKPPLALAELWSRFQQSQPVPGLAQHNAEGGDRVGINLKAIEEIGAIAAQNQAQFLLALTPLLRELDAPRDYELKARLRLQEFTTTHAIAHLDFLPLFEEFEQPESLYRDHIHLSTRGNQLVSKTLSQSLMLSEEATQKCGLRSPAGGELRTDRFEQAQTRPE